MVDVAKSRSPTSKHLTTDHADELAEEPPKRHFYDVVLSYRHADACRVGELKAAIEALGFTVFWDQLDAFKDFEQVGIDKIDAIRAILARSTCLVFAYSRATEESLEEPESDGVVKPKTKLEQIHADRNLFPIPICNRM